jgi:hypothetical protein
MVRCMLYAAAMPAQFWADAVVYATYINNRLHTVGVDGVPYNIWTRRTASVKHIRMFGAHVTVRRSGMRPTKLDPHFYTGRFLRFGATIKNLIYYDERTKREKVARHCTMDELHYASPVASRPPLANDIITSILPPQQSTPPPTSPLIMEPQPDLHLRALDKLDQSPGESRNPLPTTAVAASMFETLSPQAQRAEAVLALEFSTQSYGPSITIHLPMNQLPTLGILLRDSDQHILFAAVWNS